MGRMAFISSSGLAWRLNSTAKSCQNCSGTSGRARRMAAICASMSWSKMSRRIWRVPTSSISFSVSWCLAARAVAARGPAAGAACAPLSPLIPRHSSSARAGVRIRFLLASVEETILQHMEQGGHAVLPADFLAFFVSAAVISDGHFVNSAAQPGHFDGDLGLKPEAVGTQADGFQHLAAERLIAHLHVAEVEVAKQVAEQRQEAVRLEVPEIKHAVGAAVKAVAENRVRVPAEDGVEQHRVVGRVVFQVGILHQNDVATGLGEAGAQRRPLAAVAVVKVQLDAAALFALQFG